MNPAHAMAKIRGIETTSSLDRPVARCYRDRFALFQADGVTDRLGARALLDEKQLPAPELRFGIAQRYDDLKWEDERSVNVLMQAVEVARAIAKKKRCRPILGLLVTNVQKRAQSRGKSLVKSKSFHPHVRNG